MWCVIEMGFISSWRRITDCLRLGEGSGCSKGWGQPQAVLSAVAQADQGLGSSVTKASSLLRAVIIEEKSLKHPSPRLCPSRL